MGVKDVDPIITDPWALTSLETSKRETARLQHEWELETIKQQGKNERRELIWEGIGWTLAGLAVVAVILGIVAAFYFSARHNGEKTVRIQEERTEQVQECKQIEDKTERTLCFLGINMEEVG